MKFQFHFLFFIFIISIFFLFSCAGNETEASDQAKQIVESFNFDTTKIERFDFDCSIRAIAALDENTVWFAGSKGQYGYTKDGGKNWKIDSLKHPAQENLAFRSIAVTQENIFILSIASPALLFKSSDQGANWEVVYQENDSLAFYDAMAFWNDKMGIAMGDPTDGCMSIIKTIDGGNTWNKIPCEQLPVTVEGEAAFTASNGNIALAGDQAWIVSGGKQSRVFHSPDFGETWAVYPSPIIQGGQMTGIFSCDFYDEKTGIVMGGDWSKQAMNTGNKAITSDGGKTWKLIAEGEAPGYQSSVQYIGKNSADHIVSCGTPGVHYSADGGISWQRISTDGYYTTRKAGDILWLAGNKKMARWPIE